MEGEHPGGDDEPGVETLDLDEVRRRLGRILEVRLLISLDPVTQAEFEQLTRRERELLEQETGPEVESGQ